MKHISIIKAFVVVFIVTVGSESYAQLNFERKLNIIDSVDLKVRYSLYYQQDSTNDEFIKHEYMLLFVGKNSSMFLSENDYKTDTLLTKIKNLEQLHQYAMDPNKPLSRFQYRIYKNYPVNRITVTNHIPGDSFKYEEDIHLFDYVLTGVSDTIQGYFCNEAKCFFGGRNWSLWFTTQIPINDGPYKFNGLPGLIIKAEDKNKHYVFELEEIYVPEEKSTIYFVEKDYIITTKKGFFKAKDAFRDDIVSRASEAGLSSDVQQKLARKMVERNNPIELERK